MNAQVGFVAIIHPLMDAMGTPYGKFSKSKPSTPRNVKMVITVFEEYT